MVGGSSRLVFDYDDPVDGHLRGHAKSMSLGGGGRGVGQKDDKV